MILCYRDVHILQINVPSYKMTTRERGGERKGVRESVRIENKEREREIMRVLWERVREKENVCAREKREKERMCVRARRDWVIRVCECERVIGEREREIGIDVEGDVWICRFIFMDVTECANTNGDRTKTETHLALLLINYYRLTLLFHILGQCKFLRDAILSKAMSLIFFF